MIQGMAMFEVYAGRGVLKRPELIITQRDLNELRVALGRRTSHGDMLDVDIDRANEWLDKAEFTLQTGGVRT